MFWVGFYVVLLTYLLIIMFGVLSIMGNRYHVGITDDFYILKIIILQTVLHNNQV